MHADATLAGEAFGRTSGALMSLAAQLDEVNSLRHESRILRIKQHVFEKEHTKSSGIGRFDPDFDIATAWERLILGTPQPSDFDLLHHELFESRFEGIFQTNYEDAHHAAVKSGRKWEPYGEE